MENKTKKRNKYQFTLYNKLCFRFISNKHNIPVNGTCSNSLLITNPRLNAKRLTQIVVLFRQPRIVQTAVQIVYLQAVRFAHSLTLPNLDPGHFRFDGLFALADAEVAPSVVHYAVVVVLEVVGGVLQRLLLEVGFECWKYTKCRVH